MSSVTKKTTRKRRIVSVSSDSECEIDAAPAKRQVFSTHSFCINICWTGGIMYHFCYNWKTCLSRKMGCTSSKSKARTTKPKSEGSESKRKKPKLPTESDQSGSTTETVKQENAVLSTASCSSQNSSKLWSDEEFLCQLRNIDYKTSANIVKMFDDGNTIPFMCRYRREMINNMDADE